MENNVPESATIRYESINKALQLIESDISTGVFQPKQRLIEEELAETMGLSRTPIREALKQLEVKGLVKRSSLRGFEVAYYSANDIRKMFEVREALETVAIRLACEHATEEQIDNAKMCQHKYIQDINNKCYDNEWNRKFHDVLFQSSGNEILFANIENIRNLVKLDAAHRYYTKADYNMFIRQHYRILDSVCSRNSRRAEREVQAHLRKIRDIHLRFSN